MIQCTKCVAVPQAKGLFDPIVTSFSTTTDYASAVRRPISFHAVSFGANFSTSLRRMAQIALEVQKDMVNDPLHSAAANVASSYTEALDTVS
jgi:hypothetical protein